MNKLFFIILFILFILFILILVFMLRSYKNKKIKILNLVLFSHSPIYDEMYEYLRDYYNRYDYVDTIFYTFSENLSTEYELKDDILYIKGIDSYLPGILQKTVQAFKYVPTLEKEKEKKYDYIIRTNISTIVNFNKLKTLLIDHPIDYGTGRKMEFGPEWRDELNGINDSRYAHIPYPAGIAIIFSRKLFNQVLTKLDLVDTDVVDDVSIGKLMNTYFPNYSLIDYHTFYLHTNEQITKKEIKHYIFFRNKQDSREKDLQIMKKIINYI